MQIKCLVHYFSAKFFKLLQFFLEVTIAGSFMAFITNTKFSINLVVLGLEKRLEA